MKPAFSFLFLLISFLASAQEAPLFRIVQDERIGYMNASGAVVIQPVYRSGGEFSEGLAPVRLDGLYGFIDDKGIFVIPPRYDFAQPFVKGLAAAYINGNQVIIDRRGEVVLPTAYKRLNFIDAERVVAETGSGREGLLHLPSKKLLVDTAFGNILFSAEGVAIVREFLPRSAKGRKAGYGVIDDKGKFLVPFGKYREIRPFHEGLAVVVINEDKEKKTTGVIDAKGRLLFSKNGSEGITIEGDYHDGYARVVVRKEDSETYNEGFIDRRGRLVLNDMKYMHVADFSEGRAIVQGRFGKHGVIDRNFNVVVDNIYSDVEGEAFFGGYAIVRDDDGYSIIDTAGRRVAGPIEETIKRVGGAADQAFIFLREDTVTPLKAPALNAAVLVVTDEEEENQYDGAGFRNGLLLAVVDDRLTYFDRGGRIVWQERKDESPVLRALNIDFMNRGYFTAYSTQRVLGDNESGGWYASSNSPQKISEQRFPVNSLSVRIDTAARDSFRQVYFGCRLFISNTTSDTAAFNAQDSRLDLKLQALDHEGNWKDIEYLPGSWCGNSYHTLRLEPGAFWSITMPRYEGAVPTSIRAVLQYIDPDDRKKELIVYSNIISGSINPAQFWNKRPYHPSGIMDPYYD